MEGALPPMDRSISSVDEQDGGSWWWLVHNMIRLVGTEEMFYQMVLIIPYHHLEYPLRHIPTIWWWLVRRRCNVYYYGMSISLLIRRIMMLIIDTSSMEGGLTASVYNLSCLIEEIWCKSMTCTSCWAKIQLNSSTFCSNGALRFKAVVNP